MWTCPIKQVSVCFDAHVSKHLTQQFQKILLPRKSVTLTQEFRQQVLWATYFIHHCEQYHSLICISLMQLLFSVSHGKQPAIAPSDKADLCLFFLFSFFFISIVVVLLSDHIYVKDHENSGFIVSINSYWVWNQQKHCCSARSKIHHVDPISWSTSMPVLSMPGGCFSEVFVNKIVQYTWLNYNNKKQLTLLY